MSWPYLPTQGYFAAWKADPLAARRKDRALQRLRILQEDFKDSILERIMVTHLDPNIQQRIMRFASVALNPARDITQAVAMSYDLGVRRRPQPSRPRGTATPSCSAPRSWSRA